MRGERLAAAQWTFLTPSLARPTGGDIALFELVNAMSRRGSGPVRLVHAPFGDSRTQRVGDLPWFDFEPAVEHLFVPTFDPDLIPDSTIVVYTMKLLAAAQAPTAGDAGLRLLQVLASADRAWLPILYVQGHGVFAPEVEQQAARLPGPKVCVGSWLVDVLVGQGASADDVIHIPNGVDSRMFRVTRPIGSRGPGVTTNFDPHPVKGGALGIEVLERLYRDLGVPGTVFGTRPPGRSITTGVAFARSPSRRTIATGVYNENRVYLQPSLQEGFGMCAVEAMACGCALVTTENGGSADYALDGETALVCGPTADEMTDVVSRLVRDDDLRVRLAVNGSRFVERFRWSTSADRLAALAAAHLDRPR